MTKWIPITERLPDGDNGETVLGAFSGLYVGPAHYYDGLWLDETGRIALTPPTHWQPLPKHPLEEPCL